MEHRKTKLEIRKMIIKLSDEGCFSGKRKDKEGKYQRVIKEENHQGARPPILPISRKAGVQDYKATQGQEQGSFSCMSSDFVQCVMEN